jgi:hypothetical protein
MYAARGGEYRWPSEEDGREVCDQKIGNVT